MPDNRFKPYFQNQMRLLPLDLSEMIPKDHLVRVVDKVVESLDASYIKSLYSGGGAPAYDPIMMLKVVIFAYSTGIYSSRKISEATKSNIYFMWLTGCTSLDHMTINRFRTKRLRSCFESIFADSVHMLAELGLVTLNDYFLDGTKLEANANKYSFVWKRATETNQRKLRFNVGKLLDEIDAINEEEDRLFDDLGDSSKVTSKDIENIAARINTKLKEQADKANKETKEKTKRLKKAVKKIETDFLPRMKRYEENLKTIGDNRKSMSKTDNDATFMRMKEDAMLNGQLKAGYNIQNGTENQFVIHSTVHQRPGDTACMIDHLESLKRFIGHIPDNVVADAGYGSEQNYAYLEAEDVNAYVKYNYFHKEQKRSFKKSLTNPANWVYDHKNDSFTCANNKTLSFSHKRTRRSDLGYISHISVYECQDCDGCPHKANCIKGDKPNKSIEINHKLLKYRTKAASLLLSEDGITMRRRRATDVETVFGDIKRNWNFKRFTLRGLEKVTLEWRLLMMGHNIRKLAKKLKEIFNLPASQRVELNKSTA